MKNKIYDKIFDKFLKNTENLDTSEKTTIISLYFMIVIYCMIHVLFAVFFIKKDITVMVFVNTTSIILCIYNLCVLSDVKRLSYGLMLWILNSCYYILATIYILGFSKNSIIFIPVLLLLIHFIYPKKKKYLVVNTIIVLVTYVASIYLKLNVVPKYEDLYSFIDIINTFCALTLSILIIYLKNTADELVRKYNLTQLDGLAKEVCSLEQEASVDFLTGLWNRRYIEKQLKLEEFKNAYVVLADIDFFKSVNDEYGHLCGDYVLQELSYLFQTTFRNIDIVCRWGGEEFLIIVKSANSFNIFNKLENLRKSIEKTEFEYNGIKFKITITIGFNAIDKDITIEENIEKADCALYYGKNNGRNCVISYSEKCI